LRPWPLKKRKAIPVSANNQLETPGDDVFHAAGDGGVDYPGDTFKPERASSSRIPRYSPVKRDFFDLHPEELPVWRAPGVRFSARREINLRPLLGAVAAVCLLGLVIAGLVAFWPSSTVNVPDAVGKPLTKAMDSARGAGLKPSVVAWEFSDRHSDGVILAQQPAAGATVRKGTVVKLTVSKGAGGLTGMADTGENGSNPSVQSSQSPGTAGPLSGRTICIDPGNQAKLASSTGDWVDPSLSRRENPEVDVNGAASGNPEQLVNLDIAERLKGLLEKDGMRVVMTRTTGDVDLSSTARADIAANAASDLLVSIHVANSNTDPAASGTAVYYPSRNTWTDPFYENSKEAALFVGGDLARELGMHDRGVSPRDDLAIFNWSKVPAIRVEVGYMSNPEDDRSLSRVDFRQKAAWALRDGIVKYLQNL
jgi:N-acetylmuramoyl-L-alanine amidase